MYDLKGMNEYNQEIYAYENKKERLNQEQEEIRMNTTQIPTMNTAILEDMVRKKSIIPICADEECYKVRIMIEGKERWTEEYNLPVLVNYKRLSHSLCPEHLRDQYIKNGLEDELANLDAKYLPSDEV